MNTFIEAKGQLSPINAETHITYSFDVREPVQKLLIHFDYSPKQIEDLQENERILTECCDTYVATDIREEVMHEWKRDVRVTNLLAISLDSPEGFRGNRHRGDNHVVVEVGEYCASDGFVKGDIPLGIWKVTISVFALVSEVDYTLSVKGETA